MQNSITPQLLRRVIVGLCAMALLLIVLWIAAHIPRTITIFLIASFIAFGVRPVVLVLEGRGLSRALSVAIVYAVLLLVLVVLALVVLPAAFDQTQVLVQNAPEYFRVTQEWLLGFEEAVRARFSHANLPPGFLQIPTLTSDKISAFITGSIASLGVVLLDAATALFIALSALILSFFFLMQDRHISEQFAHLFPPRRRATARAIASEMTHIFGSFVAGQVVVSAITGVAITLLCAIVGFKYALILGVISAIAYAIPIVGMLGAHVIGAVISAPQGPWLMLWVQLILFTVARISDSILVPKIMGDSVGVSPIGVMFAVFAGGELFGLPGLILGIPAAALIKVLWKYFVAPLISGEQPSRKGDTLERTRD